MSDLVRLAALNNAGWCDAVFRAHGLAGHFDGSVWLNRNPAPRFYPNAVTLRPDDDQTQLDALVTLAADLPGGFAVKDSFAALDLAPLGFAPLFSATWIGRPAGIPAPQGDAGLDWGTVSTPADFDAWRAGWSGTDPAPSPFAAPLLADPAITLIAGWRGDAVVAGAALNRSPGALGWSNVFGPDDAYEACRAAALRFALGLAGDLPLIGYERGDDLARSLDLGFAPLGPLTIWEC
ncbi:hypothetical protein [Kaistia nematophila]|uniref:Uncharacterized protein n=1 Tax=Kaistia nematophila TaxID=2994654 RepID=A0A9X3E2B8_9HYPH|nr:hypothetical protein [Kaistia nematophila]MCX5569362.1 hypothetical protein [Kaistia nematophila]